MNPVILFVRSMRIHQWVKNVFIFAPMVFSLHKAQVDFITIKNNLLAFLLFSLAAGCIYVFNDCFDKKKDQLHPDKKKRPIASGDLSIGTAVVGAGALLLLSLAAIFVFNLYFFYLVLVYIGITTPEIGSTTCR